MYLALAREDAPPLAGALEALPPIPQDCQWAHFVRNHDELTLDKLSHDEREEVFAAFGPDQACRCTGGGCGDGCRACSTATSGASAWSTR